MIKYNALSLPMSLPNGRQVYETFLPGAFVDSVNAINAGTVPAIECNVEHGENNALTRLGKTDVNVSLENRPEGVYGIVRFINDTISDDIFTRVKTGLVRGLSVEASKVPGFEPGFDVSGGKLVRKISKMTLTGFAVTAAPAYPDSQIVKVTDGDEQPVTFKRSVADASAEVAAIASELERHEAAVTRHYQRKAFLLGIRP